MKYCIDTSSLIYARRRIYPPDVFASLWAKLDSLIEEERLLSSREVLLELRRKDDDLRQWAEQRHYMFMEPDDDCQACVSEIVTTFPTFVPETTPDGVWADPYVIAIAKTYGCTVITQERLANPGQRHLSISDICQSIKIPRCDFLTFVRQERWLF